MHSRRSIEKQIVSKRDLAFKWLHEELTSILFNLSSDITSQLDPDLRKKIVALTEACAHVLTQDSDNRKTFEQTRATIPAYKDMRKKLIK